MKEKNGLLILMLLILAGCSGGGGGDSGEEVSVQPIEDPENLIIEVAQLPPINQANVNQYPLSGSCNWDGSAIEVHYLLSSNSNVLVEAQCNDESFTQNVDFSAVPDGPLTVELHEHKPNSELVQIVEIALVKDASAPGVTQPVIFPTEALSDNFELEFHFNEPVAFNDSLAVLDNLTLSQIGVTQNSTIYTLSVTIDGPGSYSLELPYNSITDLNGNHMSSGFTRSGSYMDEPEAELVSVTITANTTVGQIGDSTALQATARYSDDSEVDVSSFADWSSSAPTLASVNSSGLLQFLQLGNSTITATYEGQADNISVTTEARTPDHLVLLQEPSSATAGQSLGNVLVEIRDADDEAVLSYSGSLNASLQIDPSTAATLSGSASTSFTAGQATLSGLSLDKAANGYQLRFTSGGLIVDSALFNISPGSASEIQFTTQPVDGTENVNLSDFSVQIYDEFNNPVTSNGIALQVSIETDPSIGASLVGTTNLSSSSGAATFSGLQLNESGDGFQLRVSSTGLTSAISTGFDIASSCSVTGVNVFSGETQLPVDATTQLSAEATCSGGGTEVITPTWSSDDSGIISVDSNGLATAISSGNTTLRADYEGQQGTIALTVTAVTLTNLSISPAVLNLPAGEEQTISVTATYSDDSTIDVTDQAVFASLDSGIASIDSSGQVSANSAGSTTVSADFGGQSADATVNVTSATLVGLQVTPIGASASAGNQQQFYATAIYSDNSTNDVTNLSSWSSDDVSIATVNNGSYKGLAALLQAGGVDVSASYGGFTDTSSFTVSAETLQSIAVTGKNNSLPANFTMQLAATGTYSDSSESEITSSATWSSSQTSIATVSNTPGSKGLVTALSAGVVDITASLGGMDQTYQITVTSATLSAIDILPAEAFLASEVNQQFYATALFSDNTTMDVTTQVSWSSDQSFLPVSNATETAGYAINTYSSSGVAQVVVTASLSGISGQANIIASDASLTALRLTPSEMTLNTSSSQEMQAFADLSDGGIVDFTDYVNWTSSDNSIAAVSNSLNDKGHLTTFIEGGTTINALYGGLSGSANLTVSDSVSESTNEAGIGLNAFYYSGQNFNSFVTQRLDSAIDFNWGLGQSAIGLSDDFSVRWLGEIKAPETADYTFHSISDESVRVYVNDELIIDNTTPHTVVQDDSSAISLTADQKYKIIVEYGDVVDEAEMRLHWSHAGMSQQLIASEHLFPTDENNSPAGLEGMALWLDSSDESTLFTDSSCTTNAADGEGVSCWKDKSGYGRHMTQSNSTHAPLMREATLNGLTGLEFDGSGDYLVDEDGEDYINGYSAFEFFVVIKSDSNNSDSGFLDTEEPDGADDAITLRYDAGGWGGGCSRCLKGGVLISGSSHVQSESLSNTQSTSPQVVGATWQEGQKFKIYVDGMYSNSWDNGTISGTLQGAQKLLIGKGPKDNSANRGWDGKVYEIIFFNTQLTNAERDQIMSYLTNKWGI